LLTRLPLSTTRRWLHVRLACVRPAASVRSEPGSNSQVENRILNCPWMESSRGSLRFDEFPTSMSDATPFEKGARATRLLAYENARPSESRRQPLLLEGRHARTPPSAFPFLRITMSKSRRACGLVPHSRTFDGSKSSIKSQRQAQRSRERLGASLASVCG